MKDAALIVALANARAARRPAGVRERQAHDALADAARASELLSCFLGRAVLASELAALRELQSAVVAIVDALIDGSPAPVVELNRLSTRHPASRRLEQRPDGTLQAAIGVARRPASAVAILTQQAIDELDGLDVTRLRRCGRPECRLVFYDRTRSGTQRWHSERPCGLRERQRRHRDARSASAF